MARMVKRLTGLEIDEVSLVNRPANQHGLVAIAKSQQEDSMSVYDAAGDEVFEEELAHGDRVYDEAGTEFVFVEDGVEDDGDEEGEEVGKADPEAALSFADKARKVGARAGKKADEFGERAGKKYEDASGKVKSSKVGQHVMRNSTAYKIGGGAAGGLAAGQIGKSLGTQVLEELSKALSDDDRDQVFAKAADRFDEIAERNIELERLVYGLYDDRDAAGYSELAKGYELPVDPSEIGAIMFRASQVLPEADMATLDRVFSSVGEISKAAFTEIGYGGGMESDTMAQIFAVAGEAVSKSDNGMSKEQAVTALFSANPGAYDEYEAEARRN